MRSGLVLVGTVIAVVGAALLITIVLVPPTAQSTTSSSSIRYPWAAANGTEGGAPAVFPSSPRASLLLSWQSFNGTTIDVWFYDAQGCHDFTNGSCVGGTPITTWSGVSAGINTTIGPCPCYLVLANPHPVRVYVLAILLVSYQETGPALNTLSYFSVLFGSILLLGIGSLAIFFGLFLRGGVFGRRPPPGAYEDAPQFEDEWGPPPPHGPT